MLRGRGGTGSGTGGGGGMAQRGQLFGARAERLPDNGAGSGLFGRSAGPSAGRAEAGDGGMRTALEEDNDHMVSELERKVAALKGATQSIHDELSEQNRMLGGMSDDFERTGGLMGGTLKRLEGLTRYAGGSSHMCSLIGFVVFAFMVLYWLMGKR